jgi:HemY protein
MIRIAFVLFVISVIVVAGLALTGDAGTASLTWLGWRADMTAAAAVIIVLFFALVAAIFWRVVLWVAAAPGRAAQERSDARRKQGLDALSRGFLAAAAGDGSQARRLAQRASELMDDTPALVRVLSAQAAESAGDAAAAKAAYTAMLGFPDMRLAALRGLMQTALSQNNRAEALGYAEEAYNLEKTARWAWRALLEDRLGAGDWAGALDLVKTALARKIVSPIVAERARAALLAASAASIEDTKSSQALDFALQSARLKPEFTPGAIISARLSAADGKIPKAAALIEAAWKESPHPALWLAYRDLITAETPKVRAKRLAGLAALNPNARESLILKVEQALIAGEYAEAREAAAALDVEEPSQRLAGLFARLASSSGDMDGARAWMARGGAAPAEPEWSDINPEGRAFAYTPADWARMVSTYAESGELIHPRYERREAVISELPHMPVAYSAAQSFIKAADTGMAAAPVADDPGFFGGAFDDVEPAPPATGGQRRRTMFRRGEKPRAAK